MINRKTLPSLFAILALSLGGERALADNIKNVLNDSAITANVKSQLLADPSISSLNISVSTKNGIVYLSGTVDTEDEYDTAAQIAESAQGVKDVDTSSLNVKASAHPVKDSLITAKVKGVFIREKLFGDVPLSAITVTVETKDRVVYLGGTADNQDQADNAVKLAKSVKGVKDVQSNIKVNS